MGRVRVIALSILALSLGCSESVVPDGGFDASVMDAGRADAGLDGGEDAGASDSGIDAAPRTDAGETWTGEGCDPVRGIECDGDWSGRCEPGCAADECCSPQNGEFRCMRRTALGACPAADLWVDVSKIEDRYLLSWREFESADCALDEACVEAPGRRRLLRFATWTPNTGNADLYMGDPEAMSDLFEYSACHDHFHFNSYARYELRDDAGEIVARGHKQSFCLVDGFRYPEGDTRGNFYTCENQGIQRDYQDVYADWLDCQWIDITDVAPGDYRLVIELNFEGLLLEQDYENNLVEVPVTVRASDVTLACPPALLRSASRNCELERAGRYTCTPSEMLQVGCSATCGIGECTGDPFLRVCEGSDDPNCDSGLALASNDNSFCDSMICGLGGDCCPRVEVECPPSGEIVVYHGSYDPREPSTCNVVVAPAP